MSAGETISARLRLELSGGAARLVRVPLLEAILRKIGKRAVPRGSLVWSKIERGPVERTWFLLDARSESDPCWGDRGPAVQKVLKKWLLAGQSEPDCTGVPAISVDDFARTAPPPDVVKCDVEGTESKVLQGATVLLERVRPPLTCEVHDSANEHFLLQWLGERVCSVRRLEPGREFSGHLSAEPKRTPQCTPEAHSSSSSPIPS